SWLYGVGERLRRTLSQALEELLWGTATGSNNTFGSCQTVPAVTTGPLPQDEALVPRGAQHFQIPAAAGVAGDAVPFFERKLNHTTFSVHAPPFKSRDGTTTLRRSSAGCCKWTSCTLRID